MLSWLFCVFDLQKYEVPAVHKGTGGGGAESAHTKVGGKFVAKPPPPPPPTGVNLYLLHVSISEAICGLYAIFSYNIILICQPIAQCACALRLLSILDSGQKNVIKRYPFQGDENLARPSFIPVTQSFNILAKPTVLPVVPAANTTYFCQQSC